MQIVIELDEKTYNVIKGFGDIPIDDTYEVAMVIINGTPLPKGHGELVDIRPLMRGLYEEKCVGELTYTTSDVYKMIDEECPTIIEADKESEGME